MKKPDPPKLKSWITVPEGSDFPLCNLPYGIITDKKGKARVATRIGDTIIDLAVIANEGLLDNSGIERQAFSKSVLNVVITYGPASWKALRKILLILFSEENPLLRDNTQLRNKVLIPHNQVKMLMPLQVGDYTDFYSSIEHATNLGKLFRDAENPLLPNWRHLPVGYHGRTSSIFVSGTPVYRPKGQTRPDDNAPPVFGPTQQLDFELEMAFVSGRRTDPGDSISTDEAEDAIFGFLMFNDLSARDIQKWEYVPLGPFLGKNFASIVSPWVVTIDALEPFRVAGPVQEPSVLPYLSFNGKHNFDINLDIFIRPQNGTEYRISHSNYKYMYWNICQQLAHQTSNGCNINVGDLYASGTISGPDENSLGSLIEMTSGGKNLIRLDEKINRKWLEDGDTVIFRGYAEKKGLRIGFGESETTIMPATTGNSTKKKKDERTIQDLIFTG